jgi:glycosyltransferase involved in cell wall biosynthesis
MHIALDYTTGIYPGAGIARYTRSLVEALARLDSKNRYSLFYAARGLPRPTPESAQADALFGAHPNMRPVPVPLSVRGMFALWQRLRVPYGVDRFTGAADVVHSPDFVSPPHRRGADVITVHDLSFMVAPECAEPKLAAFLSRAVPRAVRRADHIIAVSTQTKNDLVRLLGVAEEKVTVAYNGIDRRFRPIAKEDQGSRFKVKSARYILHVGTIEPRKNIERLIEAYGLMLETHKDIGEVGLVLAGRKGWLYEPILEAAERVRVRGRVRGGEVVMLDFVYDDELPLLYNGASVFAFPSIYEGFGIPAAEALACGVPTLVSRDGALEEVVGEAALKVDARSVEEICEGLYRLLTDEELRGELSKSGPQQVARFTWDEAARKVLGVYGEVAGKGVRSAE